MNSKALQAEVNATIKYVMMVCEELAATPPEQASHPHYFNTIRTALIRRIWDLSKECVRYGADGLQHHEPLE